MKSKPVRPITFIFSMLIASIGFSQAKYVEIFVDNGEYIKGELIAIGSDILLVRSGDRVESIERESIRLVLPTKPSKQSSRISTRTTGSYRNAARPTASNRPQLKHASYNLLDNKWMTEVSGGFYPITPFVVDMPFTQWKRLGGSWALGAGVSWNFSDYSMAKFSLQGRKFLSKNGVAKPFLNASAAWSPTAGFFGNTGWGVQFLEFSPVKQVTGGLGILIDTGQKLGLTGQLGFAATYYSTEEVSWDNRRIIASYQHYGPYLLMGFIF